ncbi:MAG TPA: APC family permease, partial [Ktedonobacterales bacterium]
SAAIAMAALLSDLAILGFVLWKVPFSTIGMVFREIFSGEHLGPTTLLTGFAGAFLAFSGLETISQLSPVMRTPRKRTVNAALTLVVITVAITSPLLTIFSTTLLEAAKVNPEKFISQLGGAYGGDVLKVLTAITASALLVFASNTAIIGAYHVFLALSRMRFFPTIVEKTNKMRGTPHVSIALATLIPMGVLLAAHGQIDLLGDMYAFGLLGAFVMTSLALDVIRWRERHGEAHVGALEEAEQHETVHDWSQQPGVSRARAWFTAYIVPHLSRAQTVRLRVLSASAARGWAATSRATKPAREVMARAWPDLKFYLGLLTTLLVGVAWLVNLKAKPLATEFGGALTIIGVGIAVAHFRYQQRKGQVPVFLPMRLLHPIPGSILVLLPSGDPNNNAVIRAAVSKAAGKPVVFLALGPLPPEDVRFMQFADPYLADRDARHTLSVARHQAEREKVPAYYVYRVGGARSVSDVWRIIQPDELIATVEVAREYARDVAPEYVRRQITHGITIEHRVRRHRPAKGATSTSIASNPPAIGPLAGAGEKAERASTAGTIPPAPGRPTPEAESENWVWTGTDLVRREPDGKDRGKDQRQDDQ